MSNIPPIDIAVTTFNSAAWIDQSIQAIIEQGWENSRIILRDDASTDDTVRLLSAWQHRLGPRMHVLEDSLGNLGIIGNCNAVLSATTAPFVMLTDPDDVWLPHKIDTCMKAMGEAQAQLGEMTPIMVCTDATVVNECLETISASYREWARNDPEGLKNFRSTIVEMAALTSTTLINRALLERSLPMLGASSQEWWLALTACAFGRIVYIPQSTTLYRRHSGNDSLGPLPKGNMKILSHISESRRRVAFLIHQYAVQAGTFLARFGSQIPERDAAALRAAAALPTLGAFRKRYEIVRHGLWFASPIKNIGLMLLA